MTVDEIERGAGESRGDDEAEFLDEGDEVAGPADGDGREIGRASCRERV